MMKNKKILISHPFHMLNMSPWPILLSITLLSSAIFVISNFKENNTSPLTIMFTSFLIFFNSMLWWRDLKRESSFQGNHSITIMSLLKSSMMMFICSEIMLFMSLFWAFFHSSISPNIELGMMWPPMGIHIFNPMGMPLLNSIILISSGISITWSHHSFLKKNILNSSMGMIITIMLGVMFSICQSMEYYESKFSMCDSTYGSVFFLTTGFHGIHVLVGTTFLIITLKSMNSLFNSSYHFISFDLSAWYWHFVDFVWLFVYSMIYWWGSI